MLCFNLGGWGSLREDEISPWILATLVCLLVVLVANESVWDSSPLTLASDASCAGFGRRIDRSRPSWFCEEPSSSPSCVPVASSRTVDCCSFCLYRSCTRCSTRLCMQSRMPGAVV